MKEEQNLDDIVENLLSTVPEISSVIISSVTGFPIASALSRPISNLEIELITKLIAWNEKLAAEAFGQISDLDFFQICFENEILISKTISKWGILTVYCTEDVRSGLVLMNVCRTVKIIAKIFPDLDGYYNEFKFEENLSKFRKLFFEKNLEQIELHKLLKRVAEKEKVATEERIAKLLKRIAKKEKAATPTRTPTPQELNELTNVMNEFYDMVPEVVGAILVRNTGERLHQTEYSTIHFESVYEKNFQNFRNFAAFIDRYLQELERDETFVYTLSKFSGGAITMWKGENAFLTAFSQKGYYKNEQIGLNLLHGKRTLRRVDDILSKSI